MDEKEKNNHGERAAWVTGAAQGIGAAVVRRLAAAGVGRFLLLDREGDALAALADELRAAGAAAVTTACIDLSDGAPQLRRALAEMAHGFGPVDILVNNAGIAPENEPDDHATWRRVLAVNLDAPFLVTAAALPHLQDGGSIVNVASILGKAGRVRNTAYCASKHGILGYTKALALDLAPRRITVNAVLPGWVDTPMLRGELAAQSDRLGATAQQVLRNARKRMPLKRFVGADEVAAMVQFLCSPEAASTTAQGFVIDAGFTCGM